MSVLAVITARGGSKGVPRKNVLPAGGKPLIAWTIEAALAARCVDRVILSSDDEEIMAVAKAWGCDVPFRRPDVLASDTATSVDVLLHALEQVPGHDHVMLLQPTSPLRTAEDIDAAYELMNASAAPACVSVCPVEESPYWMFGLDDRQAMHRLLEPPTGVTRRQDLPAAYSLNGAVYIARTGTFVSNRSFLVPETVGYVMPRERSIDIDTHADLATLAQVLDPQDSKAGTP